MLSGNMMENRHMKKQDEKKKRRPFVEFKIR